MYSVVIVAAGKGTRMGGEVDKLFLPAHDLPIIAHTWRLFDRCALITEVVIVVRQGRENEFHAVANAIQAETAFKLIPGGKERQDSVWNGVVATAPEAELVLIHDGARPCVTEAVVENCCSAALKTGASVAACRVTDTLKLATEEQRIEANVDRSRLWAVQTPQVFRREVILKAMSRVRESGLNVTDDTAACEAIGQSVALVESATPNPKVTVKSDLPFIEWLLGREK